MATTFYITAGLPAIDSADSPPSGDNKFFITAGLAANDYEPAGGTVAPANRGNVGMMFGMSNAMWLDNDFLTPLGGN